LLGKAVRLVRSITTRGGTKYAKGLLWRVTHLSRGTFTIDGIRPDGSIERPKEQDYGCERSIRCVSRHDFELAVGISDDLEYAAKPAKRIKVRDEEDDDG